MFDNVGKKLQVVAKIYMWIGILISVIVGIITASDAQSGGFFIFLLIAVFGSVGSYLSSLFLYAFGEMVENIASIEDDTGYFRRRTMKKDKDETEAAKNTGHTFSGSRTADGKKKCKSCGAENLVGNEVCTACGSPL